MYIVRVLKINANNAEVLDGEVYEELNNFCSLNNCSLKFIQRTRLGHTNRPVGIFETKPEKFKVETKQEGSSSSVQVPADTGELTDTDNGTSEPASQHTVE